MGTAALYHWPSPADRQLAILTSQQRQSEPLCSVENGAFHAMTTASRSLTLMRSFRRMTGKGTGPFASNATLALASCSLGPIGHTQLSHAHVTRPARASPPVLDRLASSPPFGNSPVVLAPGNIQLASLAPAPG